MEVHPRDIRTYLTPDAQAPFDEWLNNLKDARTRGIIRARLNRVRLGNLGDCSSVGDGVFELRIDHGPGYRVYYGQEGTQLVILLCGGDKSSQNRDILKAKVYWADYRSRSDA